MQITPSILRGISGYCKDPETWATAINACSATYGINTPQRMAAFLAQTMFESSEFTVLQENLNYSAQSLLTTFPRYFQTVGLSIAYQHSPEKIANRVYANRLGNGNEASGDGWLYRGRGIIQITGKYAYGLIAKAWGINLLEVPTTLTTPEGACKSAAWFWQKNGLNQLADSDQFTNITIRINGGTRGLFERKQLWSLAQATLQENEAIA